MRRKTLPEIGVGLGEPALRRPLQEDRGADDTLISRSSRTLTPANGTAGDEPLAPRDWLRERIGEVDERVGHRLARRMIVLSFLTSEGHIHSLLWL
jgi:hypothetical protein